MVSKVIPCKGSRGCDMERGWFMDEVDLSDCRVPIASRFHKHEEKGLALGLESHAAKARTVVEK